MKEVKAIIYRKIDFLDVDCESIVALFLNDPRALMVGGKRGVHGGNIRVNRSCFDVMEECKIIYGEEKEYSYQLLICSTEGEVMLYMDIKVPANKYEQKQKMRRIF